MEVRQSKAKSPIPFVDWLRKRVKRLNREPEDKQIIRLIQQLVGPNEELLILELMDRVPEDGAHAGAWLFIEAIARSIHAGTADAELQHYANFLLALAEIDRQLLMTQSDEDAGNWLMKIFPWTTGLDPNQHHINSLLLWASLERLLFCITKMNFLAHRQQSDEDLLSKALPGVSEDNKLLPSSDSLFHFFKSEHPELVMGGKKTFSSVAQTLSITDRTLRRVRDGESKVKSIYLYKLLKNKQDLLFEDTMINLWTNSQRKLHEAGMPACDIAKYFSHYNSSVIHIFALFEAFKLTGVIGISNTLH